MKDWNFELIYNSYEDYKKDVELVKELIPQYKNYQGKLNDKEKFKELFLFSDRLESLLEKLFTYSHMRYDINQKDTNSLNDYQNVYGLYMNLMSEASFISAEIISLGEKKALEYVNQEEIKAHTFEIKKTFAGQKHIFDAKTELMLSYFNAPLSNYNQLYDQLAVADSYSDKVVLSDGKEYEINESNFRGYLETLDNQEDRRKVFEAVYHHYNDHKNTFAAIYKGIIESNIANMKSRNYDTILDSFLEHNNIPTSVYTSLVECCHENADIVRKYYQIRKEYFKLDTLHTYDRFLNFAKSDKKYEFEEAQKMFFDSLEGFPQEFIDKAKKTNEPGRIDVYIKDGKRTGAYSTGIYDKGPFILLNYNNTLDDIFTLAHESGHSMHTLFANENQAPATANYTIFVAEVASTFNEQNLLDYFLKTATDKNERLVVLQKAIDDIIGTFVRQTLFADFELEANKLALEGKPITCDSLSQIMKDLYKLYYGYNLDEEQYKEFVWAYIPHFFHSPFYVYQYATSFATSLALYNEVKDDKVEAYKRYTNLLKAGGSDYPVELIKRAGVDLTSTDSFKAVFDRMRTLVAKLEEEIK